MLKSILAFLCLSTALIAGEFTSMVAVQFAVVTMRPVETVVEKVPRSQCLACKGTGRVKAGDTVTVVWRECENCYVVRAQPTGDVPGDEVVDHPHDSELANALLHVVEAVNGAARPKQSGDHHPLVDGGKSRRVLMFTASWCRPCLEVKGDLLPYQQSRTKDAPLTAMKSVGWTVGQENTNQFQLIDADQHPDLVKRFEVESLPTFIAWVDGREVARHSGGRAQGTTTLAYNQMLAGLYSTPIPEEPGAILRLGKLCDVQPKIAELKRMLLLLGRQGTIELRPDDPGQPVDVNVSDTTSIRISMPFKLRYEVKGDVISLVFETPPPVRYRFLQGSLTEVEITTKRINVKIKGLPDGFFEINS